MAFCHYLGGDDIPYKGFMIVIHGFSNGVVLFRVNAEYKGDGEFTRIMYEGKSIEDCKTWIDTHQNCLNWWAGIEGVC